MARIPGAFQTPHDHGRGTALVSLSATLGLAMWNAINSIVTGGVIFGVLYGVGFWAWKQDPNMLEILRASAKFRVRYDPGKWAASPWTILIRR